MKKISIICSMFFIAFEKDCRNIIVVAIIFAVVIFVAENAPLTTIFKITAFNGCFKFIDLFTKSMPTDRLCSLNMQAEEGAEAKDTMSVQIICSDGNDKSPENSV